MLQQIELVNFMSHRHTVIDLAQGLTVLIGSNNSGKSAVVLALRVLFYGARGVDFVIRHNEPFTQVSVKIVERDNVSGGDTLTTFSWRREREGGLSNTWSINGEVIGTRATPPEDWGRRLRLQRILVQDNPPMHIDPHLSDQIDPIFLINNGGAHVARFFASDPCVADLLRMQSANRRRQNERGNRERTLTNNLDNANESLDRLRELPEIGHRLESLQELEVGLADRETRTERLSNHLDKFRNREIEVASSMRQCDVLRTLTRPPDLHNTESLRHCIEQITSLTTQVTRCRSIQSVLANLENPPALELVRTAERAADLDALRSSLADVTDIENSLAEIEEEFNEVVRELRQNHQVCGTCNQPIDPERILPEHSHE